MRQFLPPFQERYNSAKPSRGMCEHLDRGVGFFLTTPQRWLGPPHLQDFQTMQDGRLISAYDDNRIAAEQVRGGIC